MNIWIDHLVEEEGLSEKEALSLLDGYEAIQYVDDGIHMATLIKKNAEVHFVIAPEFRASGQITRRRMREFLLPVLEKEKFLFTKLSKDERGTELFITRIGFKPLGYIGADIRTYILTDIKPLGEKQ